MGKWGAWPLQNLVTIVKSRRANGSSGRTGNPGRERDRERGFRAPSPSSPHGAGAAKGPRRCLDDPWGSPSSILKVSRQVFHSGGSDSCSTRMFSTIRYMTLSSTLPGQHGDTGAPEIVPTATPWCQQQGGQGAEGGYLSSVLSASEMAGFRRALLQAWLLLQGREGTSSAPGTGCSSSRPQTQPQSHPTALEVETQRSGLCHGYRSAVRRRRRMKKGEEEEEEDGEKRKARAAQVLSLDLHVEQLQEGGEGSQLVEEEAVVPRPPQDIAFVIAVSKHAWRGPKGGSG